MNKKHYICKLETLKKERYFVKWIDDWKDELIIFLGKNDEVKIFSSIKFRSLNSVYSIKGNFQIILMFV
jgi:hypothetical protein